MSLFSEILERLERNDPTLTTLDLSNNSLEKEEQNLLAVALEKNSTLTTLNLSNCILHGHRINNVEENIAFALKRNYTLKSLNLANNYLGYGTDDADERVQHMADALKCNYTLTTLNLANNNIEKKGLKSIAEALEKNSTLTTLDLSYNNISREGVKSLIDALENNYALTVLKLSSQNVFPNYVFWNEMANSINPFLDRNKTIRKNVCRAVFTLIAIRKFKESPLSIFPKDIVKLIAQKVWATRSNPIWVGTRK